MGLFSKKKNVRFETILVERERDVFNALKQKGYTLCTDPFQFDAQKSHQKLRKDAMSMAKDLHAELLVEVWDPIFNHMHWKGLKYAAWRKATPAEIEEKRKEQVRADRPDYSDSMGSYENIQKKIDEKLLKIDDEDLRSFEESVKVEKIDHEGDVYGGSKDEIGMISERLETMSSFNPYDHQGEDQNDLREDQHIDQAAAKAGPVFDDNMQLEFKEIETVDPIKDIDPLSMMMAAAGPEEQLPLSSEAPSPMPPGSPPTVPPVAPKTSVRRDEDTNEQ
ncbi:MAG: hypothetical protein U9R75_04755 [Candidatus Thermoplasmatota archaeon]|nr:hypothetical protein [Candidatus Thermoplasmatota archaeon]